MCIFACEVFDVFFPRKGKRRKSKCRKSCFALSAYFIIIQHMWNMLPSPILPFSLVFKLQSDNVN